MFDFPGVDRSEQDIFISYSRKDLGLVERFRDQLAAGGYRVFPRDWLGI